MSGLINTAAESGWWAGSVFTSAPGESLRLHPSLSAWMFSSFQFHLHLLIHLFIYICVWLAARTLASPLCPGPSLPPMQVRRLSFLTCIKEAEHKKSVHSRRDRGPERHLPSLPLSFSFSPPLCHLWQHLLPLLLFPIVRWACPLSCPPSSLF